MASSRGLFFPDLCFTGIIFLDSFRRCGVVASGFSARSVSCGGSSPRHNPRGFRCISPTRGRRLGLRVLVSSSWWWRVQVCSSAEAASRLWLRPIPGCVASSLIPQVMATQLALEFVTSRCHFFECSMLAFIWEFVACLRELPGGF